MLDRRIQVFHIAFIFWTAISLLLTSDARVSIEELKYNYNNKILYSICVSTHERPGFLIKSIDIALKNIRRDTEIVVVDDHSTSKEKLAELEEISKMPQVRVIRHEKNLGAFFTKLHGYQNAIGDYILAFDDDDSFTDNYFNEIIEGIESNYDFITTTITPYRKWLIIKKDINAWIKGYHNTCFMAFRRSLINNVEWPNESYRILRDDAPLMIPLYMQSSNEKIKLISNKNMYIINSNWSIPRQSNSFIKGHNNSEFMLNGKRFIVKEAKRMGVYDKFKKYIDAAYAGKYQ